MPDESTEAPSPTKESAWGLTVQNLTPELAQRFGWDQNERGVVISEINPGSPAGEAKLRPGDLIKEVNRQKIQNVRDYNQALQKTKKGESLSAPDQTRSQHVFRRFEGCSLAIILTQRVSGLMDPNQMTSVSWWRPHRK